MALQRIDVSVQDRYLVVDSSYPWTLHFNDDKFLRYQHGRYIADLYAAVGSEGSGRQSIRNVWLEYDAGEQGHFDWQTSEIPIEQLTGVDGQAVHINNWPPVQPVEVINADVLAVRLFEAGQDIDRTVLKAVYPIGAIYISVVSADPKELFGFGLWRPISGRFLIGVGPGKNSKGETINFAGGAVGGEIDHVLTVAEMPRHDHGYHANHADEDMGGWGRSAAKGSENWAQTSVNGGGVAHNNLPPYMAVYMWYRES